MIIRQRGTPSLWLLLLLLISDASSQPDADCRMSIGDHMYDFSALSGDHTVSRSRSLPPTNMTDTLRFNVCKELSPLEGVASGDQVRSPKQLSKHLFGRSVQCSSGTWACLRKTNIKQGESDRVIAVIPVAQEPELQAEYTQLSCAFIVTSHGSILIGPSHQRHEESKLHCMAPRIPQPPHQNSRPNHSSLICCVRRKIRSPSSSRMTVLEQSSNGVHLQGVISVQIRPLRATARARKRRRRPWAVGLDGSSFCLFSPL